MVSRARRDELTNGQEAARGIEFGLVAGLGFLAAIVALYAFAWLANEVLNDSHAGALVQTLEKVVADVPPFNYLGYHILVEAVKPEI